MCYEYNASIFFLQLKNRQAYDQESVARFTGQKWRVFLHALVKQFQGLRKEVMNIVKKKAFSGRISWSHVSIHAFIHYSSMHLSVHPAVCQPTHRCPLVLWFVSSWIGLRSVYSIFHFFLHSVICL